VQVNHPADRGLRVPRVEYVLGSLGANLGEFPLLLDYLAFDLVGHVESTLCHQCLNPRVLLLNALSQLFFLLLPVLEVDVVFPVCSALQSQELAHNLHAPEIVLS